MTDRRDSAVAVVGLGKIGLPLAIQLIRHGRRVLGCDRAPSVVDGINAGRCHVGEEPGLEAEVARAVREGWLSASLDTPGSVRRADVVIVVVPVMVDARHQVDFEAIDAAVEAVGRGLTPGTLVITETTLPVGTTAGRLRAILEGASGLRAGRDFALAHGPERVSSGSVFRDLAVYPKVVGGVDPDSTAAAAVFYRSVLDAGVLTMASSDDAELVKLIETTYRDVNIALANEFARFADARGLDVAPAIAAANTQPYSHIHAPGLGVGGHCIPVYPHFLLRDAGEGLTLPRRAREVNDGMAEYAAHRLAAAVGSLRDAAVLILGVAYRGDVREHAMSSAVLLREALERRGAVVYASDPLYADDELTALGYRPFRCQDSGEVHAIVLQAAHGMYRTLDLAPFTRCRVVLDGRRALRRETVEAAGMCYLAIGDGRGAP